MSASQAAGFEADADDKAAAAAEEGGLRLRLGRAAPLYLAREAHAGTDSGGGEGGGGGGESQGVARTAAVITPPLPLLHPPSALAADYDGPRYPTRILPADQARLGCCP